MLTRSDTFPLLIRLNATKYVLLTVFALIKTIFPKIKVTAPPKNAKSQLSVTFNTSLKKVLCLTPLSNTCNNAAKLFGNDDDHINFNVYAGG